MNDRPSARAVMRAELDALTATHDPATAPRRFLLAVALALGVPELMTACNRAGRAVARLIDRLDHILGSPFT
jgi:hypothetical protein